MKAITKTVWILSLVSLFTDTASEMLYPVMPLYLKSIGFSIVLIGLLEGLAEATAGLSKGYFGKLSDHTGKRMPLVQLGYALSALSKPLMAVFVTPLWIFAARTVDRLGKGLRTGARDAILSDEATAATKGKVFGFHRAMDTLGAVIGPLLALAYLQYHPQYYKPLFIIALAPGLLAVACSLLLKDKNVRPEPGKASIPFFSFLGYWKESPALYRKLVTALLIFTLVNSSDVFLLLKAKESGINDNNVIGVYIFYNLVYAAFALPLGMLADRLGMKMVFLLGLALFALVYFGMAWHGSAYYYFCLFFLYGIYAAATEGISKAWISNIVDKGHVATAIGTYSAFQSLFTMLASTLAGLVWYRFGSTTTFLLAGIVVSCLCLYIYSIPYSQEANENKMKKA